ncbi:MAG: DHA2 family efflux MFS transporter permease subunit [Acidimicrobiales bacterium]
MGAALRQSSRHSAGRGGKDHRYLMLPVILAATFMQLIDVSIVNVAIPSIQSNLTASFAAIELVVAGYQLAFAVTLITAGRLGDIFGRRRLFLVGMAGFTVASAVSGAAPTAGILVVARLFQGFFAGIMYPQVLSVIQVSFEPRERGKVFGIFGAVIGLATILGPLLGGVLIALDIAGLSWRLIFYVNVPIGVLAFAGAVKLLPESTAPDAPRLDLAGAGLATAGLGLLIYPLIEGRQQGWPLWLDVMLAASAPVLAMFAWYQRRKSGRPDGHPLVRWTLFHQRAFVAGCGLSVVFFLGLAPFFFTFSLYLQIGMGFTALGAGLTLLPFAVGSGIASYLSDQVARLMGKWVLGLGSIVLAVAMGLVILTIHQVGTQVHIYDLIPALLLAGIGLGLVVAPLTNIVLAEIRQVDYGAASGVLSTVQQVGGAVGVALVSVVFFGLIGFNANSASASAVGPLRSELAAAHVPAPAAARIEHGFTVCFHARAAEKDPSVNPPACRALIAAARSSPAPPPVRAAITRAVVGHAVPAAQRADFTRTIQQTLIYEIVVFVLSFLIIVALPRSDPALLGHRRGAGAPTASG